MSAAQDMADALNAAGDPHTFRVGSVLATVGGFSANNNILIVEQVSATFAGDPVAVDPPYTFVNVPAMPDPLATAHLIIADSVRYNGGVL
jgi:hypothetical protein